MKYFAIIGIVFVIGSFFRATSGEVADDCVCKCCDSDNCGKRAFSFHSFVAGSREMCTPEACQAKFSQCLDRGSHNSDSQVFASYLDCECSCCRDDKCPELSSHRFSAGDPSRCTAQQCSARFSQCPDGGSHHIASEVFAVYHDCSCSCCSDERQCTLGNMNIYRWYSGSRGSCTPQHCSAKFKQCPDPGSHNEQYTVTALYSGAEVKDVEPSCDCACCKGSECPNGRTHHKFFAEDPTKCTAEACSANFDQCPEVGAEDGEVFPSYYNCICKCCDENSCPENVENVFYAESQSLCDPSQCSARFSSCPDLGSHNIGAEVKAVFNSAVKLVVVEDSGTASTLPTAGWVGIGIAIVLAAISIMGMVVYITMKKRKGYKWISEDQFKNLTIQANPRTNEDNGNVDIVQASEQSNSKSTEHVDIPINETD
uniref:Uncharacterized protein n=1 Tax=Tetraselmis sp. GSL018 TaxID=582737 RepID=A0A061RE28_9CHLO|mmetsp:Transcript_12105/g.28712  ORF Transcript_12105/g.28712 Transcript_12105/m.28712 type:complete len:427 (-) Transcript_12105:35-1315(-)